MNIKTNSVEEEEDLDRQMVLIFDLIKSKFGNLTIPEIKEAFKMFVAGEFPELKVFRMLDCIVVADVLNAYREFRNESLRLYDQKKKLLIEQPQPMSEEEIKINFEHLIQIIFEDLKKEKFSKDAWLLYEKLESRGLIKISVQEKKELYAKQAKIYFLEASHEAKKRNMPSAKTVLQDITNKIENGKIIGSVANRCKSIVVSNFLNEYLTDFETFKSQINGLDTK